MSDEIIKVLDDLSRRFGIAVDWSAANVIPYLQDLMTRIVKYETWTSITWLVLGLIFLIIGLYLIKVSIKLIKSNDYDDEILAVLSCIACIFFLIAGSIMISSEINDIITVNTIPEKYIIEQIQYYKY